MSSENKASPGWVKIIVILVVVAFATGLLFGFMGVLFGLPPSLTRGGVGASVGIVAAVLIARRRQG